MKDNPSISFPASMAICNRRISPFGQSITRNCVIGSGENLLGCTEIRRHQKWLKVKPPPSRDNLKTSYPLPSSPSLINYYKVAGTVGGTVQVLLGQPFGPSPRNCSINPQTSSKFGYSLDQIYIPVPSLRQKVYGKTKGP
jgi:hypothetical protein